jgi:hypothetical protein
MNVTEPVGVPTPGAATDIVALRVSVCPTTGAGVLTLSTVLVVSRPTVMAEAVEVEVVSFESPEYTAMNEWLPGLAKAGSVRLAVVPVRATVPSVVAPSMNVTEPVGVPTPGATTETVALSVSDWPTSGAAVVTASAVFVVSTPTVMAEAVEVELVSFVSPEYIAVNEWLPGLLKAGSVRLEVVPVRARVPSNVVPS